MADRRRQVDRLAGRCHAGLAVGALRDEVLRGLRTVMPIEAAFFATVDPTTLLFTSAVAEAPLDTVTSRFLDNEYGHEDVNKFAVLAAAPDPVRSLDRATNGDRRASGRYLEVMAPLQLGDELRAALMSGGRCWGVLCLHRADTPVGFSAEEVALVRRRTSPKACGGRSPWAAGRRRGWAAAGPALSSSTTQWPSRRSMWTPSAGSLSCATRLGSTSAPERFRRPCSPSLPLRLVPSPTARCRRRSACGPATVSG